jgi:hypothetical protein
MASSSVNFCRKTRTVQHAAQATLPTHLALQTAHHVQQPYQTQLVLEWLQEQLQLLQLQSKMLR